MTKFVALKPKTYSYLTDDGGVDERAKGTIKCVTKRKLKFSGYKNCLLNVEIILKSQQRITSKRHNVYTEKVKRLH